MKTNLSVIVRHNTDGKIIPLAVVWEDGRKFSIDQVLDVRPAASLKSGGLGTRYTCRIRNKIVYLYDEWGCWFLESVD